MIEKQTNGRQADDADDYDVPRIASGDIVSWSYNVSNLGGVAFPEAQILVTDSQAGVTPVLDVASDDGDLRDWPLRRAATQKPLSPG